MSNIKHSNAGIIINEKDNSGLIETLYLSSNSGIKEKSLKE